MEPQYCPICMAGSMGLQMMEQVRVGTATIDDLAIYFNCNIVDVAEHYASHSTAVAVTEFNNRKIELINHPDKLLDKLYNMISYMEELTEHYKHDEDLKYERSTVETILKIFQRLESVVMRSAELQGFIKQPQNTTNIAVIDSTVGEKVDKILEVIRDTDICGDCKVKILNELDVKGLL